jgi:hypothetical protein
VLKQRELYLYQDLDHQGKELHYFRDNGRDVVLDVVIRLIICLERNYQPPNKLETCATGSLLSWPSPNPSHSWPER